MWQFSIRCEQEGSKHNHVDLRPEQLSQPVYAVLSVLAKLNGFELINNKLICEPK